MDANRKNGAAMTMVVDLLNMFPPYSGLFIVFQ
jgi:hypothetical protein